MVLLTPTQPLAHAKPKTTSPEGRNRPGVNEPVLPDSVCANSLLSVPEVCDAKTRHRQPTPGTSIRSETSHADPAPETPGERHAARKTLPRTRRPSGNSTIPLPRGQQSTATPSSSRICTSVFYATDSGPTRIAPDRRVVTKRVAAR
jgi:hypothetical protein